MEETSDSVSYSIEESRCRRSSRISHGYPGGRGEDISHWGEEREGSLAIINSGAYGESAVGKEGVKWMLDLSREVWREGEVLEN